MSSSSSTLSSPVSETVATPTLETNPLNIDVFKVLGDAITKGIKAELHTLQEITLIGQCLFGLKSYVQSKIKEEQAKVTLPPTDIETKVSNLVNA